MDAEAVAQWAARPWRGWPIHDDLLQEARIAIWQAEATAHGDPVLRCQWLARRRVIDAVRRWTGRSTLDVEVLSLDAELPPSVIGVEDVYHVDHPAPPPPATLTPAERRVWDGLAAGWSQQDIARRWGVTPTAVCFHVRRIREKLAAELRCA